MDRIKTHIATVILTAALVIGLCFLLYPTVSDRYNSYHQTRAISDYEEQVARVEEDQYRTLLEAAQDYNHALRTKDNRWRLSDGETETYNALLDITETGIMGYLEIDKISVSLPIYHGVSADVLQTGVGHIPGTSLPVGGESTHCVLSGHRGLASAKLLTDLDRLEPGDTFVLHVLGETLTYQVDQILAVEPDDLTALGIEEGKDLCTLVTCTPYGVNSQRLLVRGHRVENGKAGVQVTEEASRLGILQTALLIGLPIVLLLLLGVLLQGRKRKSA